MNFKERKKDSNTLTTKTQPEEKSNHMSENEPNKPADAKSLVPKPDDLNNVQVTRNGVTVTFVPTQIKKGKTVGTWYLGLDPATSWENRVTYMGLDKVQELVAAKQNALAQGWTDEATNAEDHAVAPNKFNEEDFIKNATEFSARGETIAELTAQRNDAVIELTEMANETEEEQLAVNKQIALIKQLGKDILSKKRVKNTDAVVAK